MKTILLWLLLLVTYCSSAQQWEQRGQNIIGEAAGDKSGQSVHLSRDGNTLAIGAPYNIGSGNYAGHVRVYTWDSASWQQKGTDIFGETAGDLFGWSVCLSDDGNTLAVGAPNNENQFFDAGHVRVYSWDGIAWLQRGNDIDGEDFFDQSGIGISLSSDGNTLAVGANINDGSFIDAGHVRIYTWDGITWQQKGGDIDGEMASEGSGFKVSLSNDGNTVAIGAFTNGGLNIYWGQVRIYSWNGFSWQQRGMDINGEVGDCLGTSVCLSGDGNTVAIGADNRYSNPSNIGYACVFEWTGISWQQKGGQILGEHTNDWFGSSISLSDDGNVLAVGARFNSTVAYSAGSAKLFIWTGSSWVYNGVNIYGEASNDEAYTVSLNKNGNFVAIGARISSENGFEAGHVRVFGFENLIPIDTSGATDFLVEIYPNPVVGQITINTNIIAEEIIIFDILGNEIMSITPSSKIINPNLNTLANGTYFIKARSQDKQIVHSFVLVR